MKKTVRSATFIGVRADAFTLVEMVVAMGVLLLLMTVVVSMLGASQRLVGLANKHMDTDSAARGVFDRMAVDFAQMFRRADVDYYLKTPATPQVGNDQIAFYSQVPGYSSSAVGAQSQMSLIAYRINSDSASPGFNQLQRFGYGLVWNGIPQGALPTVSAAATPPMPMVFSPGASNDNAITKYWPVATNMVANPCYESAGAQVFRMEYSYLLKGQTYQGSIYPPAWSDTPWNANVAHTSVNGLQDVAAIRVVIAVVDAQGKLSLSGQSLNTLAGNLPDFSTARTPNCGDLEAAWETVILGSNNGIPHPIAAGMRVYARTFYLPSPSP